MKKLIGFTCLVAFCLILVNFGYISACVNGVKNIKPSDCSTCYARGKVRCKECSSKGTVLCKNCDVNGSVQVNMPCYFCSGSGKKDNDVCQVCSGSGSNGSSSQLLCFDCNGTKSRKCIPCNGEGYIVCEVCNGTGKKE